MPTLGLWVGPRGVAVASNEQGFTERDVRALCDVGASSKAHATPSSSTSAGSALRDPGQQQQDGQKQQVEQEEAGQTGEKGIGFKSVFAVTDRPCVASGGFVFGFDADDASGIGMVLPRWLGGAAGEARWPCPPACAERTCGAWRTRMWLPAADRCGVPTFSLPVHCTPLLSRPGERNL